MSINEMINELKHYTNNDIEDYSDDRIREMYISLFGGTDEKK